MSELTISLTKTQEDNLQQLFGQIIEREFKQFRPELGWNERYMKKKQLCKYLNLCNNTVDKLIALGLPKINIAGVTLYDRLAVDTWLKIHSQSE